MGAYALTSGHTSVHDFAERIFEGLPRADQRRWAHAYVQSLLTTPGKKSVRRLAAAVSSSPAASQALHQFVNASPWEWLPIRAELTRWVEQHMTPRACVISQAMLRKRGEHSCGVHRRFLNTTGRSVTCQVGIGMFLGSYSQVVPVDWRLLLPGSWSKDPERRTRARIPADVGARSIEQHALDLIDTHAGISRAAPLPVVADLETVGGVSATTLVHGLAQRGRDFVFAVPDRFPVAVALGRPLRSKAYPRDEGQGLVLPARRLFEFDAGTLTRIENVPPAGLRTHHTTVMSGLVRLPKEGAGGMRTNRTYRLFAVRPESGQGPVEMWLTSLTHTRMESVLALTQTVREAEDSVSGMAEDFGLLDFEGRSYPGWHHHMTLVSAAYACSSLNQHRTGGAERILVAA